MRREETERMSGRPHSADDGGHQPGAMLCHVTLTLSGLSIVTRQDTLTVRYEIAASSDRF